MGSLVQKDQKMNSIKKILSFSALLFAITVSAQEKNYTADSTEIEIRTIDQAEIEKLKADPEMDYGQSPAVVNLWERFKRWFLAMLGRLLQVVTSANWFSILILILIITGLVYVIMRLLKVDARNMFFGNRAVPLPHGVIDDDIYTMDFEALIEDAKKNQDYRLAIRLLFLFALKLLTDKHHVYWQPGKTNHDYVNELSIDSLKTGFNELSFYFEYAWYGNFSINEALYGKVKTLFNTWRERV